jgi:hypothetical protein
MRSELSNQTEAMLGPADALRPIYPSADKSGVFATGTMSCTHILPVSVRVCARITSETEMITAPEPPCMVTGKEPEIGRSICCVFKIDDAVAND